MSLLVKKSHTDAYTAVVEAAAKAVAEGIFPEVALPGFKTEVPGDRKNGDISANAAMVWARELHNAPRKIAEAIVSFIQLEDSLFDRVEVAGPGFINFYYGSGFYSAIIDDIFEKGSAYGRSDFGKGQKINVEFVSANPTGPMHMGNARGGALGDCLAAVLDCAGYEVSREFYINDAGNQIDKFALSLDIRYRQLYEGENAPELPEDSYHGADIMERAKEFADIYGDSFIAKSEAERRKALVDYALPKNIDAMKSNLLKYRIEYDTWFHESVLHNDGEIADIIRILKENGLAYEKDGALWYNNTKVLTERYTREGKTPEDIQKLELKDEVLIRANGNPTYFAADIAYHRNKFSRGFTRAINIWGADHHGHVARMKGALDAIGLDGDKLDIVLMQLVNLKRNGEAVRMSKRTGKAITLTDLLEEIPIDAVRFLFNMREPGSQMDFDLDLAVEQSSQNPVYYCQYAHARICSIIRKLEEEGIKARPCSPDELALLNADEEKELILHLAALTDEVVLSAKNYDPAKITRYAIDLATLFHKFYNACRVNCGEESLTQARLNLCLCVKTVLSNILTMFKISVPESM